MSLVHPSRSRTDSGSSVLMSARDSSGLAAGAATVGGWLMQPDSAAAEQAMIAMKTPGKGAHRGTPIGSKLAMEGTCVLPACSLLVQRGGDAPSRSTDSGQQTSGKPERSRKRDRDHHQTGRYPQRIHELRIK